MNLHVHFQISPQDEELDYLIEHLNSDIKFTSGVDIPDSAKYEILVAGRPERALLEASDALAFLIIPWAGIPSTTHALLMEYPHIQIHNLHYNASATAEFAMGLYLAAAKKLVPIDRAFRSHDWTDSYLPDPSILVEGKQALILGYGQIGRRVARMCLGFEMRVVAVRRSINLPETEDGIEILPVEFINRALTTSDAIFVCLPETSETRAIIGERELNQLPEGAILVNISRGAIVEERALYEALSTGKLGAAGLDVWYQYPETEDDRAHTPPSIYPFHELENVVMSPHRGGGWNEAELGCMEHLVRLLNKAAQGEPMENLVEHDRGY